MGFIFGTFTAFAVVQGYYTIQEKYIENDAQARAELRIRQERWFSALSFFSKVRLPPRNDGHI